MRSLWAVLVVAGVVAGCGEGSRDLSKVAPQPDADLEKGRNAKTLEEWASANPNNGAPGSGEGSAGK
ncbi:MAG: hypothetical protein KIS66_04355 [Fimbriimonadaceae bacterium]|nr:hypothetical protein [Fimbriimonadaceae bacterium]